MRSASVASFDDGVDELAGGRGARLELPGGSEHEIRDPGVDRDERGEEIRRERLAACRRRCA